MKTAVECPVPWKNFAMHASSAVASVAARMEHRWGHRRPCRAQVCISVAASFAGTGRMRNVSMSGAYLETTLPLALHSQIAVAVLRDDGSRHVEYTATVVRRDAAGVGIEWLEAAEGAVCRMLGCADGCAFSGPVRG